ncbi:ATP synthase subunit f, mitochondrial-like [Macaca thibetana thibetana]|uniref:ATP synthase subunit f, mitochondrial-like n=1 Tax=Macaca thibetana thibetana TaxID=257877 RepID=UPI001E256D1F|nr:ATP synthase subunit f, mitochondrial-like [Macaca fascicularis]XP_050656572.1 ATP synthase subunit f, mitochondrial-like [Macaca thibetana thibetana]
MASVVPVKDKKLLEFKLGELPSWILMWDFSPSGTARAFQRGYYRYYKYINVKKGIISGVTMVLAAYVLFSY